MLWPILQIFDQDLLKWIQWCENVSKLIRTTLESTKVNSNGEKSNREKIPKIPSHTLSQICKSSPKATIAWSIVCKTLIYDKQTQLHQRNQNQIQANLKINLHVIMVMWPIYNFFPTLHPPIFCFCNQTWPTLSMSSKTMSRWATFMLTTIPNFDQVDQKQFDKIGLWNKV